MAKKAELEQFHRNTISTAADKLFMVNGVEKTTMDDIAKAAEYSKATLYVYFKSKDEIFHYITLKSMAVLHDRFSKILHKEVSAIDQYMSICETLAEFYEKHPLHFQSMLETIAADVDSRAESQILEDIYQTGEMLNDDIKVLLQKGVQEGVFKEDLPCVPTGLIHWAALSGIVSMGGKKQDYIGERTGMKKKEFMKFGFLMILNSILKGGVTVE